MDAPESSPPEPRLLSMQDIAALCGVSYDTVQGWRSRGALPAPIRLPPRHPHNAHGAIRWRRDAISDWLDTLTERAS